MKNSLVHFWKKKRKLKWSVNKCSLPISTTWNIHKINSGALTRESISTKLLFILTEFFPFAMNFISAYVNTILLFSFLFFVLSKHEIRCFHINCHALQNLPETMRASFGPTVWIFPIFRAFRTNVFSEKESLNFVEFRWKFIISVVLFRLNH